MERSYPPIAIIGIGCRMPCGVSSTEDFWKVLRDGKDCIDEVPPDRWSIDAFYDNDQTKQGKMVSRKGGFIDGIDKFDNTFFKISPKEAASMDPQQRILLEVTHEAFEDAGIVPDELQESCGVFVGIGEIDYGIMACNISTINPYTLTGICHSVAANRLSHVFNLKGPSLAVDTACASSMTAMHLACNALWNRECDMTVLAGANALIIPETSVAFSSLGVLSPDGKSCPFSDSAKGYVRGEGWGTMILKPLSEALNDNNHIYDQIIGTYVAANGHSPSLTMPSKTAQVNTMIEAYRRFNVDMSDVDYLEAHGTSTAVGDPIEAEAIGMAFGPYRKHPIRIGSVKSNFGHTEYASGAVSSIKVALMLHKNYLVPSINHTVPNRNIRFDDWNLYIQKTLQPFPKKKESIVGINSFGFAGALAHVIMKSPPEKKQGVIQQPAGWSFGCSEVKGETIIVPLSAKSPAALEAVVSRWEIFESDIDAFSVVGWQATKRKHHECRLSVTANSSDEFRSKLKRFIRDGSAEGLSVGTTYRKTSKICFIFPGQGQQWANMGKKLYATETVFRETVLKCDEIFSQLSGKSLVHNINMFNGNSISPDDEKINDMIISQPAILFLQIALYELWKHWGLIPDVVVGHSLGEVAAAYACGGLTLEEAVEVIYHRSINQTRLKGVGSMVAVRMTLDEAKYICGNNIGLHVAAENAPKSLTLAGYEKNVLDIVNNGTIKAKQLRVQCAFHTPLMDQIEDPFRKSMEGVVMTPAGSRSIPFYSTVTGEIYSGDFKTDYWWNNIRSQVKFRSAIENIVNEIDPDVFVECAASATLVSCVKQIAKPKGRTEIVAVSSGQRQMDDRASILHCLGQLYTNGVDINWQNVTRKSAQWVEIPKYPWQHSRLWMEDFDRKRRRLGQDDRTYKGQNGILNFRIFPFLADHVVQNRIVFPAAGYVEYVLQSFFGKNEVPAASNFSFKRVCTWPDNNNNNNAEQQNLELKCVKDDKQVSVTSAEELYSTCTLLSASDSKPKQLDVEAILKRCTAGEQDGKTFYDKLRLLGLQYGPSFQVVNNVILGDGECIGYMRSIDDNKQRIQTTLLDGAFQLILNCIVNTTTLYLPVGINHLKMYAPKIPAYVNTLIHVRITECDSFNLSGDITIATNDGKILATISGVKCKNLTGVKSNVNIDHCLYHTVWQPSKSCFSDTSTLQDVFQGMKTNKRYLEDLKSISKVEERASIVKGVCASYIRHGINTGNSNTFKINERYLDCLEKIAADKSVVDVKFEDIHTELDQLKKDIPEFGQEIEMIRTIGDQFSSTLTDPDRTVKMLFKQEMLPKFFLDSLTTKIFYKSATDVIEKIVNSACKYKQVVRILELGGRMGGLARHVLEPLKILGQHQRVEYLFTNLSSTFDTHAKNTLKEYSFVKHKKLNIEADTSSQGFNPASIDLVVCFDSLHPVKDITSAIRNIKDLLVNDGLFLLYECTNTNYIIELVFGALDHYWLYSDFRDDHCWLTKDEYARTLQDAGFVDVVTESTPAEFFHSVYLGRKLNESKQKVVEAMKKYIFVVENESYQLLKDIRECLSSDVTIKTFSDVNSGHIIDETQNMMYEVVYLWGDTDQLCRTLLKLFQKIDVAPEKFTKLWVVTSGSNMVCESTAGSHAIGLTRAVINQCTTPIFSIDIDPGDSVPVQAKTLVAYMTSPQSYEREITIRNGSYFYPRLAYYKPSTKIHDCYWQLTQSTNTGLASIGDLGISYRSEMVPSASKVLVKVKSASLNFKDVMMSLGMLDDMLTSDEKVFGLELSGVIETVGDDVTGFSVGDEVIGMGEHCLASHTICDSKLIVRKPPNLSWDESSGVCIVFATSYHSLVERANLQKGETVLIHSACGGVGLSAIQVAKMVGANIICTAGTEEKRHYLKEIIGIERVTDSRSDVFVEDVMAWTNGRGVDVVLNSLYGELLLKGVKTLAPGGRFCEIGKRDILNSSNLNMQLFLENKSFLSCQIDFMVNLEKRKAQKLLQKVASLFENGTFKPIPYVVHKFSDYNNVFLSTAKGTHIGKVIFSMPENFQPLKINESSNLFKVNGTYVVSGGFGGIGLALSRWIVKKGAKHVVMVARRGCRNSAGRRTVEFMKRRGATVYEFAIDLGAQKNIRSMLDDIASKGAPPVKGLFHLSGYIATESLQTLTTSEIEKILYSKSVSAQYFHELTKELDLDVFFMLSSVSSLWGHASQPMYVAANNYLDALATYRRRQGLQSLSVQLGPISGAGYLEGNPDVTNTLSMKGNNTLHVEEFLGVLSTLLQASNTPPVVCLANQNWSDVKKFVYKGNSKFEHLVQDTEAEKSGSSLTDHDLEVIVKDKLSKLLLVEAKSIDIKQPMINYGVDSLMAVELVRWASKDLNITLSQLDILGGLTTKMLLQNSLKEHV